MKLLHCTVAAIMLIASLSRVVAAEDPDHKAARVMRALAAQCVRSCDEIYKVKLDFSLASLKELEKVFTAMHDEHQATPIDEEGLSARSMSLGAYVGEVVRRELKAGTWRRDSDVGEATFPLELASGTQIFPVSWAYERIVNGDEDNIPFKVEATIAAETK